MLSNAKACREGFEGVCVRRYTEGRIYSNCWLSIAKLTKLKNMEALVRHCERLLDIERQALRTRYKVDGRLGREYALQRFLAFLEVR